MTPAAQAPSLTSPAPAPQLARLYRAAAVRERCRLVHRFVADGRSPHFTLDESKLPAIAAYVAEVTRAAYPDLAIPYHSRWRHFCAGGIDRWDGLAQTLAADRIERARTAVDLATVSVLLDAGAGDAWRYREPGTGHVLERSEGLAVASLDMFRAGGFSGVADQPCRVDTIGAGADRRRHLGAPLPGHAEQSADRGGAAQRAVAPPGTSARRAARSVRPRARASRPPDRLLPARRRRRTHFGADAARHPAREPVGDLAVGPDARRRRRSAMPAAIRRCAPETPPTGSCRSTSSPNGSPIRCSSRSRPPASRWWISMS